MTKERYEWLMKSEYARLTPAEFAEGWHFCSEWDGLLIHPNDPEAKFCTCPPAEVK